MCLKLFSCLDIQIIWIYIDGLVQQRSNAIALAFLALTHRYDIDANIHIKFSIEQCESVLVAKLSSLHI